MRFKIIIPLILLLIKNLLGQQNYRISINEFLASNITIDADMVDFDDYSDWIELYNNEDFAVDIIGYYITDDLDNPYRWQFTETTIIPARGFLRVWADGYDINPGKTRIRPYRDQNGDPIYFTTKYHHLNFSLSRAGEAIGLFGPDSVLIDSVTYTLQQRDVSMGRKPDGSPNWYFFGEPTAAYSNITDGTLNIEYTDSPEISPESGFYTGSLIVTIDSPAGGADIRYTMDGSKPSSSSLLYQSPITINETTVIRARIFENEKLPGPVITRTYFIDESISIPVISIISPPAALFDDKIGIYDNIFKGREIPIHFELFETGGIPAFSLDAGLRLTGQLSLFYAQKSFTIYARERYGTEAINYQVFPQRELDTFTSLYLRNAGVPDNQSTFFRDALIQALVLNKIDIECQAYRPAVVFLNGEYWGIYNIRDKINTDYIGTNHNLNPDDIDLLEYDVSPRPVIMEGNDENYNAFYDYIGSHDLSLQENYQYISNWMDIDEYINYQICEIFADNIIWLDQNVRMWRERKEYGKWRWILFDTDFGFGMPNQFSTGYTNNTLEFATNSESGEMAPPWATLIFRKLLENEEFKTKFIQKFAVYLNTIFYPDSVLTLLNQLQNVISPEMVHHISRWRNGDYGTPIQSYSEWLTNVNVMKNFAANRPQYQIQHIVDYFGLSGTSVLTIDINNPLIGRIKANGNEWFNLGESAVYFKDIPLELEAIPKVGYRFVSWQGIANQLENPVTVTSTADNLTITALFEPVSINLIPSAVSSDTILSLDNSPYYTAGNVTVDSNVTLQVEEGVEILMSKEASIVVHGRLQINGTEQNPVTIKPNEYSQNWGAICFVNASDSSVLANLKITGATKGADFSRDKAAISGYNSNFSVYNVTIVQSQAPLFAQYGKVAIKDCYLETDVAGDLINIKYAASALVENCVLKGNDQFDTDAIDYDQISNGIIRGNRIYNFYGFNSDAIDLGEDSQDILIENNIIYNINDKGVSIGHGSTGIIKRNVIANCGQGVGIKDFNSYGFIEHTTFYANRYGIACFEKNIGHGGGSAEVVNCIIANSINSPLLIDELSHINISYSLSNTDELTGLHNIYGDPGFINNLYLHVGSLAIDKGNPSYPADPDGTLPDLGAYPFDPQNQINLIINEIHYNPPEGGNNEFFEFFNAGKTAIAFNQFTVSGDINHTFGNEIISPGEYFILAKDGSVYQGQGYKVFQWESGNLRDGPGEIIIQDEGGEIVDFVNYDSRFWWTKEPNGLGPSLELHHPALENMVSSSWRSSYSYGGTPGESNSSVSIQGLYINEFLASNDNIYADEYEEYDDWIELYNATDIPINLGGLYITDNLDLPGKYQIPTLSPEKTTIPPEGYFLFWADGQTEQGILHLPFKLDQAGEQIGLVQISENDTAFIDSLSYGEQLTDISYGRYPDGSANWYFFENPSPLDSNQWITDIKIDPLPSLTYSLSQNYPNPFNPLTRIRFSLPEATKVKIVVYDLLGKIVTTLLDQRKRAGNYEVIFHAADFSSGIYFYKIETDKFSDIKKMILLK